MKVFFIASPRGNLEHDQAIYSAITALGYVHTSNLITTMDPQKFYQVDGSTWGKRYTAFLHDIARADACVFEVSIHSLAMGQLLQEAVRREKPVIALYFEGQRPQFLQGAEGVENRVQVVEYTIKDLNNVLADALAVARDLLETRFTMLMPANLIKFLNAMSDKKGMSRSEYIRQLIEREMKGKV